MKLIIILLLGIMEIVNAAQINEEYRVLAKRNQCYDSRDCPSNAYCFVKSAKTDRRWCVYKGKCRINIK